MKKKPDMIRYLLVCAGLLIAVEDGSAQSIDVPVVERTDDRSQKQDGVSTADARDRTVTMVMRDATLENVLQSIAKQANLSLTYSRVTVPVDRKISVFEVRKAKISDALEKLFQGTGLTAVVRSNGQVIISRQESGQAQAQSSAEQSSGTVAGIVTDSLSGTGISGVTVTVGGSRLSTVTSRNGGYIIRNVPSGNGLINFKLLGYHSKSIAVVVPVDTAGPLTMNVKLAQTTTSLAEVVTTVTGMQRKVEIGNDITTIKVEEVMRTNPVSNLSEMLAHRVPGLYAAKSSGQPGMPTRIRIRGVSSINTSNDPIIVVDGVQIRSQAGKAGFADGILPENITGMSQSPLDQIDLNTIETIEVLKGPSAVALYGSDAANGVIVITRKKGIAGATKWSSNIRFGTESIPGKWPQNYFAWGTYENFGGLPFHCPRNLWNPGLARCIVDSLSVYQILNNKETSPLGRGRSWERSITVSGGSDRMTYSLTGSSSDIIGIVQLPLSDRTLLREMREAVTEDQIRPTGAKSYSVAATSSIGLMPRSDLLISLAVTKNDIRSTPLSGALNASRSFPPARPEYDSAGNVVVGKSGLLDAIPNLREQQTNAELGTQSALVLSSNYFEGFNARISTGLDIRGMGKTSYLGRGQCLCILDSGSKTRIEGQAMTGDVNASLSIRSVGTSYLNMIPVIGFNYTYREQSEISVDAQGLPLGSNNASQASYKNSTESYSNTKTAGAYLETRINIGDKLWLPLAIRSDAGSALGGNVMPKFPKISFSYLLSDEPAFSRLPFVGKLKELRIRTAFGVSGKQPLGTEKYRTYGAGGADIIDMVSVGNPNLKPERSREFEFGGEAYFIDNDQGRLGINLTFANKRTTDLIISDRLAPSLGGPRGLEQYSNLGDVLNRSWEGDINGSIHTKATTLTGQLQVSMLRNKLVKLTDAYKEKDLGVGENVTVSQSLHVIGYPLYGQWAKDVVSYGDMDGDGVLQEDEVLWSDNFVFRGPPYPKFTSSFASGLTLFTRLTFSALLAYENGATQELVQSSQAISYTRSNNDPKLSLQKPSANALQSVSTLRWNTFQVTYVIPGDVSNRLIRNSSISIALDGKNIGVWSTYQGKDPNVGALGEVMGDRGQIPAPRSFGVSVRIY